MFLKFVFGKKKVTKYRRMIRQNSMTVIMLGTYSSSVTPNRNTWKSTGLNSVSFAVTQLRCVIRVRRKSKIINCRKRFYFSLFFLLRLFLQFMNGHGWRGGRICNENKLCGLMEGESSSDTAWLWEDTIFIVETHSEGQSWVWGNRVKVGVI